MPFFVAYAWLTAALLLLLAYESLRHGEEESAASAVAASAFVFVFMYWEKRRISRKRTDFDDNVAAYERSIANQV